MSTPLVRAAGTPFDLGYRHGAARAGVLRAFLADGLGRLNHLLPEPVSLSDLRPVIAAHRAAIGAAAPDLEEEIRGLAAGAGITVEQAVLLQLRREVLGYRRIPPSGGCTTYALAGPEPLLAQTVDLNGNLDDQIAVLSVAPAATGRRVLVLSFGGLLGYLGLNSDGLAVGLNLVLGGQWRPGVPPYLAIRYLLDHAGTVDEAVAMLRAMPLASSRTVVLCDAAKAVYVELLGRTTRVVDGTPAVHTNHFLHPDLAPADELNVFARNSSQRRLAACRQRLAAVTSTDPETHLDLLATEPIWVADTGDIRRDRTVAAVALRPDRGELHLRAGCPATSASEVFTLA